MVGRYGRVEMKIENKQWRNYEEVAAFLLNEVIHEFGLDRVEGKQEVRGHRSGTDYEIDAKAVAEDDSIFFIVECRRYTTSKQNQDKLTGLAYRILDSGASGGIVVSPLGLQEGAARVAAAENIHSVLLDKDSTRTEYLLRFLNQVRIGIADRISAVEHVEIAANCAHCGAELNLDHNREFHCTECGT
jgi:hypothetical protein